MTAPNLESNRAKLVLTFVIFLTLCVQLFAHHGTQIYYDIEKPIKLAGTVTKFVWSNPHVLVCIDVKQPGGPTVNWTAELNSPNTMIRAGWDKRTLKAGDKLTVTVFPAKIGTPIAVIDQSKAVIVNGNPLQLTPIEHSH